MDEIVVNESDLAVPQVITPLRMFDHIQDSRKRTFLEYFSKCGIIAKTCELAAIKPSSHYYWIENDDEYKKAFEIANDIATDVLEAEATRRAMNGSDVLLIFLLKARKPHIFREQKVVIGGNVQHEMKVSIVRTDSPQNYLSSPQTQSPTTDS